MFYFTLRKSFLVAIVKVHGGKKLIYKENAHDYNERFIREFILDTKLEDGIQDEKYIFMERKGIYIMICKNKIFRNTYNIVRDAAADGKTILFVGTKKQAGPTVKEYAEKCMPYVNHRWLGMLTNFGTIRKSIRKLEVIEQMEEDGSIDLLTKRSN